MRTITLTENAINQLNDWRTSDPRILAKIVALIADIAVDPFSGIGKPEPLKHNLKGKWSRRINEEHRVVYEVSDSTVLILSCRFHY